MIGDIVDILLAPLSWVVSEILVFAATAPLNHVYIAMGVAFVLLVALIWSMIPKKHKEVVSQNNFTSYVATDEDEAEARKILQEVQV